jgi:hypothetical protein
MPGASPPEVNTAILFIYFYGLFLYEIFLEKRKFMANNQIEESFFAKWMLIQYKISLILEKTILIQKLVIFCLIEIFFDALQTRFYLKFSHSICIFVFVLDLEFATCKIN